MLFQFNVASLRQQDAIELDAAGAEAFANVFREIRGAGAAGSCSEDCRRMAPETMADVQMASRPRFYPACRLGVLCRGYLSTLTHGNLTVARVQTRPNTRRSCICADQ